MKTKGKVLIELAMVMALMLGVMVGVEKAEAIPFDPGTIHNLDPYFDYEYIESLMLNSPLTMTTGSQLDVTGDVTNNSTLTMESQSGIIAPHLINNFEMTVTDAYVSGNFTNNGTLDLSGAMFVEGSFFATGLDDVIRGRVSPLPAPPPPGWDVFNDDFLNTLASQNINYGGAAIFSTGTIQINSLDLYFDSGYIPLIGDRFLVAATTVVGGISPTITLTHNLGPGFQMQYIDPSDGTREYAYVEVSQNPVPEPATLLLFGSGMAGLAFIRRKRGKHSGNS